MANQRWLNEGGIFYPIVGEIVLHDTPGPGVWQVYQSPNLQDRRLGLVKIDDSFKFDYKIYNFGGQDMFEKIEAIWNSDLYTENNKNLGIIYNGTKGTGKTVSAKLLCNKLGLPVILVNHTYEGMILDFIQALEFECIIFIDEAEKTFTGQEQEILLKMIDGVYNKSRKLYILTTNTLSVNENLISRPGRIRYVQEFGNLDPEAINEYIDDNLVDSTKKDKVLEQVDLLEIITIDILKAIVDEVNILGDIDDGSNLNIPKAKYCYDVLKMQGLGKDSLKEVKELIKTKPANIDLYTWMDEEIDVSIWEQKAPDICKDLQNYELPQVFIKECEYSNTYKMHTSSSYLYRGASTSLGEVLFSPDDLGEPDYVVLKDKYSGDDALCLILRARTAPSLFHGRLKGAIKYIL